MIIVGTMNSAKPMDRPEIDPEIAIFAEQLSKAWGAHPPFATLPIDEARKIGELVRAPWRANGPKMEKTLEHLVPTSSGKLKIRLYNPGVQSPSPALIYLHGGGFILFSIDTHDRLMREYAAAGQFCVLGVDYPLSPEARYPTALNQIVELVDWLHDGGAAMLGIDDARLAIGGDSAGGNLSIATALRLRDRGTPDRVKGLLLNYGAFSLECSDEAEARFGGTDAVLQRAEMDHYYRSYLGSDGLKRPEPYAAPMLADLRSLPPTFLAIPECDILSEQSYAMEQRLNEAGVEVSSIVYRGATHSFLEAMSVAKVAKQAIDDGARWVAEILKR